MPEIHGSSRVGSGKMLFSSLVMVHEWIQFLFLHLTLLAESECRGRGNNSGRRRKAGMCAIYMPCTAACTKTIPQSEKALMMSSVFSFSQILKLPVPRPKCTLHISLSTKRNRYITVVIIHISWILHECLTSMQQSHFCPIFDLSNFSQVSRDTSEKKVGGGPWKVTIHGGVLKLSSSFSLRQRWMAKAC